MLQDVSDHDRLNSWKEIAAYVGRDVRTVIRWEQRAGLPVYRIPVGQRQAVHAYRSEIDAWMRSGGSTSALATEAFDPSIPHGKGIAAAETSRQTGWAIPRARKASWLRLPSHLWVWLPAAVLIALSGLIIHSLTAHRGLEFTEVTQITSDGNNKQGLVTDGKTLYFAEERDARTELASVSVHGGPIHFISTPLVNAVPRDLSPDGRDLLVLGWEGDEQERPLWVVPVDGRAPRRLGAILCHSAAWSPDGRHIAFAYENSIYLTNESATAVQQLHTFSLVPILLRWTPDGSGLRFALLDSSAKSRLWQLTLEGGSQPVVSSLVPLHIAVDECCNSISAVDRSGDSFLGGVGTFGDQILLVSPQRGLHHAGFSLRKMNRMVDQATTLALDPDGTRLFVLSDSAATANPSPISWTTLISFDPASRNFRPYLPGISAHDLNFSRDGKQLAWVGPADQTVWIGRADGSDSRRIPVADIDNELPRWSPDGRRVAFMAKYAELPWRIFIFSVDSGRVEEASSGTDSQGAPTWSPDGKWVAYGNVQCEETASCAIHKIEMSTGREFTIPGSEGLETARWSPDGRFIAALQPEDHEIYLFNVRTQDWKKLAGKVNGSSLEWSPDSRYLYASNPNGDKPGVLRFSLRDNSVVSAVDFSGLTRWTGRINPWFALAPDNSIILLRKQEPREIYALALREK